MPRRPARYNTCDFTSPLRAALPEGAHVSDERNDEISEQTPQGENGEHSLKQDVRGAVAKVIGIAVEAGSMLSGHSGEMVSAEGAVAEADTDELIHRIDGEE